MGTLMDKLDSLFTVERKDNNFKRIFMTFVLLILVGVSLPMYFMYEDYAYNKYKDHYEQVKTVVEEYKLQEGVYPVGEEMSWSDEKQLNTFFQSNNFNQARQFYYIDKSLLSQWVPSKYTYIIEIDTGTLYTSEFVVFKNKRWHLAYH
ncbi:hypothetical protein Amet_4199 [Alkaliphilus metalliredigens QYMF]|uniref:Uncharacterized protein n=1 Tax=Alkaliphilus metalliredigens (strain QYMF) TaxID=293826 RepID=A6TVR1_ALKMQ|nr:hypothetical protein [Alkaliphilus metalliredigens]ABR50279.1 hypothetical protein Amet_4199 [Alkaliphilus metalliredigens QYMF]